MLQRGVTSLRIGHPDAATRPNVVHAEIQVPRCCVRGQSLSYDSGVTLHERCVVHLMA